MDVSIIIVNWNTRDILRDCLKSVYEQTHGIDYEVIVVDNNSTDGSAAMIQDEFSHVRLIANNENRGFAAANNQGILVSGGRFVLLLNPDTLILDGAIQKTIEYADAHPQYGVVGCQVWENDMVIQKTCFRFHSPWNYICAITGLARLFPGSLLFGGEKMREWDRKSEKEVDVVSGMFMLVRREAIEQVGLMDESFFIYGEEADWCYRMKQAGWENVFWPGARIIHRDGGNKSSEQVAVKMEVQKLKSLLLLMRKHYGVISMSIIRAVILVTAVIKLLCLSVMRLWNSNQAGRKLGKFAGIIRYSLTGHYPGLS